MKKTLLILISLCFAWQATLMAQPKSQRLIYLWDVTLSMKGYQGKTPDIYADVVKFLEQEINSIADENAEIVVLPFQESILEQWQVKADKTGKNEIIRQIKNYRNDKPTNTNIVDPIKDVKANYTKPDKQNELYILTDGKHSRGSSELVKIIEEWGRDAQKLNAYALYVMLTNASVDKDVIATIEKTDNIDVITETIFLEPEQLVVFNIKDDKEKPVNVALKSKENVVFPGNIKIKISAENNPNLIVNPNVIVKDGKIAFAINQPEAEILLEETLKKSVTLRLDLQNRNEIQKSDKKLVSLNPDKIELELIKNPEKKLIIHYE
jgi:hypothetical protein